MAKLVGDSKDSQYPDRASMKVENGRESIAVGQILKVHCNNKKQSDMLLQEPSTNSVKFRCLQGNIISQVARGTREIDTRDDGYNRKLMMCWLLLEWTRMMKHVNCFSLIHRACREVSHRQHTSSRKTLKDRVYFFA